MARIESAPALHGKNVERSFEETLARTEEALEREGFGILCRIDVQAKLKSKLGVDMQPLQILGACIPAQAHKALSTAPEIAIMLPCNVVVRGIDEGRTRVEVVNTDAMVQMFPGRDLSEVASTVGVHLGNVLKAI